MKKQIVIYFCVLLVLMIGPKILLIPVAFLTTLAVPVRASWNKQIYRNRWRTFALLSCIVALSAGGYSGFFFKTGNITGFPFQSDETDYLNAVLNFSVITSLVLLPLSAASTYDTWKRRQESQ